jgi:hypothetical protein
MALVHKVDWDPGFIGRSAWLWPLADAARGFRHQPSWPDHAQLDALYADRAARHAAPPLRFIPQVKKRREPRPIALAELYDGRIAQQGEVPTRASNWHDLLNALCFATFPRSKHALHTRQYRALRQRVQEGAAQLPASRTREQDALTLFDEGGVAIAAQSEDAAGEIRAAVAHALVGAGTGAQALEDAAQRARHEARERALFDCLALLEQHGRVRIVPFGHALFEHMVEGLPWGASARIVVTDTPLREDAALLAAIDAALARELCDPRRFCTNQEAFHMKLDAFERAAAQAR